MPDHANGKTINFAVAIAASAALHGVVFGATLWQPSQPAYAVRQAPSSLEINYLERPVVTVMEPESVAEDIAAASSSDEFVIHDLNRDQPPRRLKPAFVSQKSDGAVSEAKPLMYVNPAPVYPIIARQKGWEGTVRLEVRVSAEGHPGEVRIQASSGYRALDESALDTVRQWQFTPARSGQIPFSSSIVVPIRFALIQE